jgi:L,D-peptidoglycan transpeptidase YkuD (ErfK/YbiS/YcfS/YnhG family)
MLGPSFAQKVIEEVNKIRLNPKTYSNKIRGYLSCFQGNVLRIPKQPGLMTQEGPSAYKEAADFLLSLPKLQPLTADPGLTGAAQEMANELGRCQEFEQMDNIDRNGILSKYGEYEGQFGESTDFGSLSPEMVVVNLLVDDGDKNRRNRKLLFKETYQKIGCGCVPHNQFKSVTVIMYANNFVSGEGIIKGKHGEYGNGIKYVKKYRLQKNINQLILVEQSKSSITKGTLWLLTKDKNGVWHEEISCLCYLGKKGLGKEKEGDGKTPIGDYGFTMAFGVKKDPGSKISYTKITDTFYCCGDKEYYNQIIDTSKIDHKCTDASEHLISYLPQYYYSLVIDYNKEGEFGKGSGIFLHCIGKNEFTGGCVAVEEKIMVKILQTVDSFARICIYPKDA